MNMLGIGNLLDSEEVTDIRRERDFVDPNTGIAECDRKLQELKKKEMELAPDSDDELEFEVQSSQQSTRSAASSRQSTSSKESSTISSKKSSNSHNSRRAKTNRAPARTDAFVALPQQESSAHIPSEISAREFKNNPVAEKYVFYELLDEINELKSQLKDEGMNMSDLQLPQTYSEDDIETLELIRGILVRKVRKSETSSIVEDLLILGLEGVERLFNGKTELFAGVKPNLKGLTKTMRLRLRNQKHFFAGMLEDVCEKYEIGPVPKLLAQTVISSIKRAAINEEGENSEDYLQNLQNLENMHEENMRP